MPALILNETGHILNGPSPAHHLSYNQITPDEEATNSTFGDTQTNPDEELKDSTFGDAIICRIVPRSCCPKPGVHNALLH